MEILTQDGNTDAAQALAEHVDLLRRCVELGVDATLNQLPSGAPDEDELLALLGRALSSGPGADVAATLQAHPQLLDADDDEAIDELIAGAQRHGNQTLVSHLEQVRAFLGNTRRLRGITAGGLPPEQLAVLPLVYEFVRARTWRASRQVVRDHPELLEPAADRVLELLVRAAERMGDDATVKSFTLHRRLLERAREAGVPAAFDEIDRPDDHVSAAEIMRQVREAQEEMDQLHTPNEIRVSVLGQAATMLMNRFRESAAPEEIDAAIECWRGVVAAAERSTREYPYHLHNLGTALTTRYTATRQLADLREAMGVHRDVLASCARDHPNRPGWTTNLGNVLADLHAHTGEEHFLDEAVIVYEQAVELAGHDADNLTGLLVNLAEGLRKRFDLRKRPHDLDEAVTALRAAIDAADPDDPLLADITSNLAITLVERSDRNPADLDDALAIYQRVIPRLRDTDDRWVHLGGYGDALQRRAGRDGRIGDLDEAAASFRRAAAAAPDPPRFADSLVHLGDVLRDRFARSGDPRDLDQAIHHLEAAVATVPPGQADATVPRSKLALALSARYDRAGSAADLDAAITHLEYIVTHTPSGSHEWAGDATTLGNHYLTRSGMSGDRQDLDNAVRWHEIAVRNSTPNSPDHPGYLSNWGTSLRARYEKTGGVADLEQAVAAHAEAVTLTPDGSEHLAGQLIGWATALRTRYDHTGDLADLINAIDAFRRAVAIETSDRYISRTARSGLATSLRVRFDNTHEGDDLDVAIALYQSVLDETPPTAPERADRLVGLANALDDRYGVEHDLTDLQRAITLYRDALRASPPGWAHRPSVEVNLADSLLAQPDEALDPDDVGTATRLCEDAIAHADERSPELPRYLITLAAALRRRNGPGDDETATAHYRRCCQLALRTGPRSVLAAANVWGGWASERGRWAEAAEAYRCGVDALELLIGGQRSRSDKEEYLRGTQRLAVGLAYALTMLGQAREGVVALERGRADLLAEQLGTETQRRQQPTFESIAATARAAPIAYLAATPVGGLALIVGPAANVREIRLPDLRSDALRERMLPYAAAYRDWLAGGDTVDWDIELDNIGRWLWTHVMGPVLAALPDRTPELVLVPGGLLGLLPLHAACIADPTARTGRRYVLDDIRISYAANAQARGAALRMADTPASTLLIVEEPRPVQADDISAAAREAERVGLAFAGSATSRAGVESITHLRHEAATHSSVRDGMAERAVLHLCCHGSADVANPLRGGLLLAHDRVLTVAELMVRRQALARLAVLSACESAMIGARLPDEVVGLPSALAAAGVGGVVGALWAVPSTAMARLAIRFYEIWRAGQMEPAEALRQAQQHLRDRGHSARPSAWAAMTYTGA